jgi:hypothetical protein
VEDKAAWTDSVEAGAVPGGEGDLGKRERGEPSGEERGTCVGVIGKMNRGMGWGLTGGAHHQAVAGGSGWAVPCRTGLRASQPAGPRERGGGGRPARGGRGRLGRQKEEKGKGRVWGHFPIFPFNPFSNLYF